MDKKMMPYMQGQGKGYVPPQGNAGSAAKGEYSHKRNPMSVPRKGSSIRSEAGFGRNADREKVMRLKDEQARKESLRGIGC